MTNLVYTPTENEIYNALNKSGIYKTSGKRMIIENSILAAFCIYFIVSFCLKTSDLFALIMAVVCAVFIFIIWFVPHNDMKKQAKSGSQEEVKVSISESMIKVGSGEKEWKLPLDGTSVFKIVDDELYTLKTPDNNLLLIPKRVIPADKLSMITGFFSSGCTAAK